MYEVTIKADFSAAHKLKNYKGKCENLHGHNYVVEVSILCNTLNESYIAMDFKDLKAMTNGVISKLDHTYLNDLDFFNQTNPTAEKIAEFLFKEIQNNIRGHCKIKYVTVYETENSKIRYFEE